MDVLLQFGLEHPLAFIALVGFAVAATWFGIIKLIEKLTPKQ